MLDQITCKEEMNPHVLKNDINRSSCSKSAFRNSQQENQPNKLMDTDLNDLNIYNFLYVLAG